MSLESYHQREYKNTIQLRHQLSCRGIEIRAVCYDTRRHHLLLYDHKKHSATSENRFCLYSLSKQIKNVAISSYFPNQKLKCMHLYYAKRYDMFICVLCAIARSHTVLKEYLIMCMEPQTLQQIALFSGDTFEQLDCCSFDSNTSTLIIASTQVSPIVQAVNRRDTAVKGRSYLTMLTVVIDSSEVTTAHCEYHLEKKDQVETLDRTAMICVSESCVRMVTVAQTNDKVPDQSLLVEYAMQSKPSAFAGSHCLIRRQRLACAGVISSLAISQDSLWLFVGLEDGTIHIWCMDSSISCEHVFGSTSFMAQEKLHDSKCYPIRSIIIKRHESFLPGDLEIFATDESATTTHWRFSCIDRMIVGASVSLSMHVVGLYRAIQHQKFHTTLSTVIDDGTVKTHLLLLIQSNVISIVGMLDAQDVLWKTPKESILGMCSASEMDQSPVFVTIGTEKNSHVRMLLPCKEKLSSIDFGMYAFTDIEAHKDPMGASVSALYCFQEDGAQELWVVIGRSNSTCDLYLSTSEQFTKMAWLSPQLQGTAVSTILYIDRVNANLYNYRKEAHDTKTAMQNRGFLCVGYTDGHIGIWYLSSVLPCKALALKYLQKNHSTSLCHLTCIRAHRKCRTTSKLVAISIDGLLKIWKFPAMAISHTISTTLRESALISAMELIAENQHHPDIAVVGNESGALSVWNLDDSTNLHVSNEHKRRISSIVSIPSCLGREFATASWDSSIIIWEVVVTFVRLKRQIQVDSPIIGLACNSLHFIIAYSHEICGLGYERDVRRVYAAENREAPQIGINEIQTEQDPPSPSESSITESHDEGSDITKLMTYLHQFIGNYGLRNTIAAEQLCDFMTSIPTLVSNGKSNRRATFDLRKFFHAHRIGPTERLDEDACAKALYAFICRESAPLVKKRTRTLRTEPRCTRYNELGEKVIVQKRERIATAQDATGSRTARRERHATSTDKQRGSIVQMIPKDESLKIVVISNQFRAHWDDKCCWCGDRGEILIERKEQVRKRCLRCGNKANIYNIEKEDIPLHFSSTFLDRLCLVAVSIMAEQSQAIISQRPLRKDGYRSFHDVVFQLFERKYGMRDLILHKVKLLIISIALQRTSCDVAFVLAAFFGILTDHAGYEAPKELVAFCISAEAWLISRDAIITRSENHELHRYVPIASALACIKDISDYLIVSPRLLSDILAALSGCHNHQLGLNRMVRVIIQVWQQDEIDLEGARCALFGVSIASESIHSQSVSTNLDKLQFLLTCFLFHDPHRSGAVPENVFQQVWLKLRHFWIADSLYFDAEQAIHLALCAIILRFRDTEHDGAISYIDFWAMLYLTRNKQTAEMLSLHRMTVFCQDHRLGIPSETQDAILTFMQRVRKSNLPKYNHNVDYDVTWLYPMDHTVSTLYQQGTFHLKKLMHSSLSAEMLLDKQMECTTAGLYIDGEHPVLRHCHSTPVLCSKTSPAQEFSHARFDSKREIKSRKTDRKPATIYQQEVVLKERDEIPTLPPVVMTAASVKPIATAARSIKAQLLEAVGTNAKSQRCSDGIHHREDSELLHRITLRSIEQQETRKKAMAQALSEARRRVRQARGFSAPLKKRVVRKKIRLGLLEKVLCVAEDSSSMTTAHSARTLPDPSLQEEAFSPDPQLVDAGKEDENLSCDDENSVEESQVFADESVSETLNAAGDTLESEPQHESVDDTFTVFEEDLEAIAPPAEATDSQTNSIDEMEFPQSLSREPDSDTFSQLGYRVPEKSECDDRTEQQVKAIRERDVSEEDERTTASSLMSQLAKTRLRLDDATEEALYREKALYPLEQEVVLSKELEKAMRKKWNDIFEANERLLFHGCKHREQSPADNSVSELCTERQLGFPSELAIGEELHGMLSKPGSCALYQYTWSREHGQVDNDSFPVIKVQLCSFQGSADMFMSTDWKTPSRAHQWSSVRIEQDGDDFDKDAPRSTRTISIHAHEIAGLSSGIGTATSITFYVTATARSANTRYSISVMSPVRDRRHSNAGDLEEVVGDESIATESFDQTDNLPLGRLSLIPVEVDRIHHNQAKHRQSTLLDLRTPQRSIPKLAPVQKPSTLSTRRMIEYMPKPVAYSLSKLDK